MAKLFGNGKGWHNESLRHRQARIFGKAPGGKNKKSKTITGGGSNSRKNPVTMRSKTNANSVFLVKFVNKKTKLRDFREISAKNRKEARKILLSRNKNVGIVSINKKTPQASLLEKKLTARKNLVTMTRPRIIRVGKERVVLPGLTVSEAREKAAFERELMKTSDYKTLQKQGWSKDEAIAKVMKEKGIKTKPGTKWFSLQNLPPNLKKNMPDKDKDGAPDKFDCEPNNPKKQDSIGQNIKQSITFIVEKEKTKAAIKSLEKERGNTIKKLRKAEKRKDFTEVGKKQQELKIVENKLVGFQARLEFFE